LITGRDPAIDVTPFAADRFAHVRTHGELNVV
jgi:hypothetical protein